MKIIQIIPNFGFGGAEIMCENLCYELTGLGHEVIVISLYNYHSEISNRIEKRGIPIIYLKKHLGPDLRIICKLKKILKKINPDIIHTHLSAVLYSTPATLSMKSIKKIHTVHNMADKELIGFRQKLNYFNYKLGVVPVALSPEIKKSIIKIYHLNSETVPIVFNGINLDKYKKKANYDYNEKFVLIHVGRFAKQKNHKGLIEAFKIFHERIENSQLCLIGNGEEIDNIKEMVSELHLQDCVEFCGNQTDVYSYLNKADTFILPSLYEGIPLTIIEAMGTGLPIIATRVGGIPDLIVDGENGLLTDLNAENIANAIYRLATNKDLRQKLGNNGFLHSKVFSAEYMAKRYCEVYENLISKEQ